MKALKPHRSLVVCCAALAFQAVAQTTALEKSSFAPEARYAACFTPGMDCEEAIVSEIRRAKQSILVQAYSFTSPRIARALVDAKARSVDVRAILDKSQRSERYTGATFLQHGGIPVTIDEGPAIAHSKIMIIDARAVLTGSFNFTSSAQERNAENLIIIEGDQRLVRLYTNNWERRSRVSVPYWPKTKGVPD